MIWYTKANPLAYSWFNKDCRCSFIASGFLNYFISERTKKLYNIENKNNLFWAFISSISYFLNEPTTFSHNAHNRLKSRNNKTTKSVTLWSALSFPRPERKKKQIQFHATAEFKFLKRLFVLKWIMAMLLDTSYDKTTRNAIYRLWWIRKFPEVK